MEFNLKTRSIAGALYCLDSVAEQAVDLDLTLPDYCPDIEKILKCSLTPQIFSRNLTGGQLVIEGASTVQILYVDAVKKNIRCCEQTIPFSSAFSLKETPANYAVLSDTKPEYLNCRALSPRKLVLHGAFSLYAKVISRAFEKVYLPDGDDSLEAKCEKLSCCELSSLCQEQFSVSEDISAANKPPIEAVLSKKVTASITEIRVIPSKILINGEVNLKLLYLSDLEAGEPVQLDYMLPFNRIIDCETATEDTEISLLLQVLSFDVRLKSDMLSENPVITLDVKLSAFASGFERREVELITDAYSTGCFTELEYAQPSLMLNHSAVKETLMQKSTLDLGTSGITKIIDLFCENCTVTPVVGNEGVTAAGKATVCVLAYDRENNPVYIERMLEFERQFACESPFNGVINPSACVKSVSYRLSNDFSIEVRCEITVSMELTGCKNLSCVSRVSSPDDRAVTPSPFALTLYYAQKGEKLWDIAKRYNTRLKLLTEENSIDTEVLENPAMLLIPGV